MKLSLFVLSSALSLSHLFASTPLDNWAEYPKPAGAGALNSVVFGNGVFVAGGNQGAIVTSTNGADWTKQNSGTTGDFNRMRFVNGRFFGIASDLVFVSTNGIDWALIETVGLVHDVAFANGLYYAAPVSSAPLLTSSDLINWTSLSNPVSFLSLTYGNNIFVAANADPSSRLASSSDAEHWSPGGLPGSVFDPAWEVNFQSGVFSTIYRGQTWPSGYPGTGVPVNKYILGFSANGLGWSQSVNVPRISRDTFVPVKIAAGGQYYVFPDRSGILYTTDLAAAWTGLPLTFSNADSTHSDVVFGNEVFVALIQGHIFKSNPVTGSAPIRIIQQPSSVSVNTGGTVILSVLAQGTDPITFQWRKNSQLIENATANTLTLTNVTLDSAGDYDVVITNASGPVTSDKATVTVHFADVRFYAGVTLRGNIGDKFSIEYQDQIDPSGEWHLASNVTLSEVESVWYDRESPDHPNRFYRATFLGR